MRHFCAVLSTYSEIGRGAHIHAARDTKVLQRAVVEQSEHAQRFVIFVQAGPPQRKEGKNRLPKLPRDTRSPAADRTALGPRAGKPGHQAALRRRSRSARVSPPRPYES